MSNRCECDERGTDPEHAPGQCESHGRPHIRNGSKVLLCVDCVMTGDVRVSNWVVGHNMPGYLPESDPWITSDWEQARDYLIGEIESFADYAAEVEDNDEVEELERSIEDLKVARPNTEWGDIVGNTSFWLSATDEEPEDEE